MGKKLTFWLVTAGLLLPSTLAYPQNLDSLTGIVLDIQTSQPVENARIYLEQRREFSANSDKQGNFKLKFDPPLRVGETVKIHVEKEGFKTLIRSLPLSLRALTLELTPQGGPNYRKWISLGVSLAAAGAAVAFFQAADDSRENAEASRTAAEFEEFDQEFQRNKILTLTFEIVAGAAGGYFLYEQIFRKESPSEAMAEDNKIRIQIRPDFVREGALIVLQKRF